MAKYKKEEIHMIDMSGRLKMKIIHEEFSSEDEENWEKEIINIDKKIEDRMKRYEEHIKFLFTTAPLDENIDKNQNAEYFIKEYSEKFIGRNPNNIKNRLDMYKKYLEE